MSKLSASINALIAWRLDQAAPLPNKESLVQDLLTTEKLSKQQKQSFPAPPLLDNWQLCFVTGGRQSQNKVATGRVLPPWISIQLTYSQDLQQSSHSDHCLGYVENSVKIGTFTLTLTGPFKYHSKVNIAAFDFTQMHLKIGRRQILSVPIRGGQDATQRFWDQPLKEQAFFRYFLVADKAIAARGRGGGLALWIRSSLIQ